MSTHKKIAWESWNAKIEAKFLESTYLENIKTEPYSSEYNESDKDKEFILYPPKVIYTPIGIYPEDYSFKPSDRWSCWLAYTNFGITNSIKKIIEELDGVEALKILGKYTFFIGVAKLFNSYRVKKKIETCLCSYTEQEILSNEDTQLTVDLIKEQLSTKKYWSMLVSPEGKIEYVVSDAMDKVYLDGLNNLVEMKKQGGGIILRGHNG